MASNKELRALVAQAIDDPDTTVEITDPPAYSTDYACTVYALDTSVTPDKIDPDETKEIKQTLESHGFNVEEDPEDNSILVYNDGHHPNLFN